jgi:hypothetical protein
MDDFRAGPWGLACQGFECGHCHLCPDGEIKAPNATLCSAFSKLPGGTCHLLKLT